MNYPQLLQYEAINSEPPKSLPEVIGILQELEFDPETEFYEFIIDPLRFPISSRDLHSLLSLPIEVALTNKGQNVILTTGNNKGVIGDKNFEERSRNDTGISAHSHPIKSYRKNGSQLTVPSFADAIDADLTGEDITLILIHAKGISIYRSPYIDPLTAQRTRIGARDLICNFLEARGIDFTNYKRYLEERGLKLSDYEDLLRSWNGDVGQDEQVSLQDEFAHKSGMIKEFASWDDKNNLKRILDIINLRVKDL